MARYHCLFGAFPDIHSVHIYNDMHGLYARAIDRQGRKVAEILNMTPGVLAAYFGGELAAPLGARWLAESMTEPTVSQQLREIGEYLSNRRQNGNLFVIVHVAPSPEGACQNHEVLVTNKHETRARLVLPSCAVAALAMGALNNADYR